MNSRLDFSALATPHRAMRQGAHAVGRPAAAAPNPAPVLAPALTPARAAAPPAQRVTSLHGLTPEELAEKVAEFMEVDRLSRAEAEALAAVSVRTVPAQRIRDAIAELDALIAKYCELAGYKAEAKADLLARRRGQSAATILQSVAWFRQNVALLSLRGHMANAPEPEAAPVPAKTAREGVKWQPKPKPKARRSKLL